MRKLVLVGLACALAVGWLWFSSRGNADRSLAAMSSSRVAPSPASESPAAQVPLEGARLVQAPPEPAAAREDASAGGPASAQASDERFEQLALGRCIDSVGRPLADVVVERVGGAGRTSSGPDGKFRLTVELARARRGETLALRVRADGRATLQPSPRIPLVAGEPIDLGDLVLFVGGDVSGRVIDASGAPFPEAEVLVAPMRPIAFESRAQRPGGELAVTRTDGAGSFLLEHVPAGDVRVWAGASGMWWGYLDSVRISEGGLTRDVLIRLEPIEREDVIELLVLDPETRPVPGAPVQFHYHSGGTSGSGAGTTDGAGRYRKVLDLVCPHDFAARDPGDRYRPAVARGVPAGTRDLVLILGESRTFGVRVRDLAGGVVPGYELEVQTLGEGGELDGQRLLVSADEAAQSETCRLQLPSERFQLRIEAEGYQTASLGPWGPSSAPAVVEVELMALPGVRGRILDGNGAALAGARVGLHGALSERQELVVNGFPARSNRWSAGEGISDEQGDFAITLRESGSFFVRASMAGFAVAEVGPLELTAEAGLSGLELVLGAGAALEGVVLLPAGQALEGVIIGASRGDGFATTQRTDASGRYRFENLTPGRWLVRRVKAQILSGSTTSSSSTSKKPKELPWNCELYEGRTTRYDIDLSRSARVVLTGHLCFDGVPASGFAASLRSKASAQEIAGGDRLDSQGRFQFELEEPGTYVLQLFGRVGDSAAGSFLVQDLELGLGANSWQHDLRTGQLEVRSASVDAADGIKASWTTEDGLRYMTTFTPDESGSTLVRLPAGTLRIHLRAAEAHAVELPPGGFVQVEL